MLVPLSGYRNLKSLGFSQALTTASPGLWQPCAAFHPVAGDYRIFGAGRDSALAHQFDLGGGVILEAVDGYHNRDAEALGILDMGLQVGADPLQAVPGSLQCIPGPAVRLP